MPAQAPFPEHPTVLGEPLQTQMTPHEKLPPVEADVQVSKLHKGYGSVGDVTEMHSLAVDPGDTYLGHRSSSHNGA